MIKKGALLTALILLPACASVEEANDMSEANGSDLTMSTTIIPDLPEGELTNEMFETRTAKTR